MNKNILLFKTLLLSTSSFNICRYTKDKKKKRKIVAAYVGLAFVYAMFIGYSLAMCIGFGQIGVIDAVPGICAMTVSVLSFILTMLRTNGYMFNFKEYDMLMALPFEVKTVAACKFLYMYAKSLPMYLCITLAMMAGYGYYAAPSFAVYPVWLVLSFVLPVIPMLLAAFIGFIIVKISSGFKKNNIVQTILTMIFIIFCFSLRYIIDAVIREDKVEDTLNTISESVSRAGSIYLPIKWFSGAITNLGISDMLLLLGISLLLFAIIFRIVGSSYRNINSALKSHAAARNYRMTVQKKRSVLNAIAFKEFKRLTGSTAYMTNAGIGEVLAVLFGVVTLIIGFDKIVFAVTQCAPIDVSIIRPAIPLIVYFFIGMVATTACSPSLEGKNYWIVQSLPIKKKTLYQGKMLFNMYLSVPFMLFSIICLCISAKVPIVESLLYLVLGVALCCFSTAWGCVCGIKHMKLDWENEIEVIKQGTAVAIYMLPNMFVVMGLIVLVVFLGTFIDHKLIAIILTFVALLLAMLSYMRVMALSKNEL